ncbi:MAG: cytochrome b561 [Alphaproteobacteria bacterium]|jgi:cytochrome b561
MKWKNSNNTWGAIAMFFHWLTALAIISLFALGFWMVDLTYYSEWYKTAPFIHKSIGILLLILTLLRVLWRLKEKVPQPLEGQTLIERKTAHIVHVLLYILIFAVILSGYLMSTAAGRAINVFNVFEVSALPWIFTEQGAIAGFLHEYLAYAIIALASLHALAALKHHFVDKDNTLNRMIGRIKK